MSNASLEEMVAMKLAASRVQDLHDLEILARHMNITTADELVQIAYDQYGEDSMALTESREEYLLLAASVERVASSSASDDENAESTPSRRTAFGRIMETWRVWQPGTRWPMRKEDQNE